MATILSDLCKAVTELDIVKFKIILNDHIYEIVDNKPKNLNQIITECVNIKSQVYPNGCDFLELFIQKLNLTNLKFVCWDESCKSIVEMFLNKKRKFTNSSICFLIRCYDLELICQVIDNNLLDSIIECDNWHLMFVASYQQRFFNNHFTNRFESFLVKYVLICKLKCSLKHKRSFLTWFAGSLHLYSDEYFLEKEEKRFKFVLLRLFECLILNGLLNNNEYSSLVNMLIKRNEEITCSLNQKILPINQENETNNEYKCDLFTNLSKLFPLTLKNACRLAIKRNMNKYNKKCIGELFLPVNLKKFVYYENECESVFEDFKLVRKEFESRSFIF